MYAVANVVSASDGAKVANFWGDFVLCHCSNAVAVAPESVVAEDEKAPGFNEHGAEGLAPPHEAARHVIVGVPFHAILGA